jgi:hypothetical protein
MVKRLRSTGPPTGAEVKSINWPSWVCRITWMTANIRNNVHLHNHRKAHGTSHLVEQIHQRDVNWQRSKVVLQEHEQGTPKDKRIVDGDHADAIQLVPAGMAASGHGRIHDVIGHKKTRLQLQKTSSFTEDEGFQFEKGNTPIRCTSPAQPHLPVALG